MSTPTLALIGMSLVVVGLLSILVLAMVRLRAARRSLARRGASEEAFMAIATHEVLAGRDPVSDPSASPPRAPGLDTTIVAGLPMGVLVVRQGGSVVRVNAATFRLLDLDATTALPARLGDLLAGRPTLVEVIERALESKQSSVARMEDASPDETIRPIGVAVSPMPADPGVTASVLVLLSDLSDDERRQALERHHDTMRHVADMASSLAHELANTLTGVNGYARMIEASALGEADRATLEALLKEIDTLGETIEGFRRITRPLPLTRERFPARWLLEDAARHVVAELQVVPDAVTHHLPDGLEIEGDRILLEDALMHLLRNAVEACTDAGIRPDVRVTAHASTRGAAVAVVVEDNGPGVGPAERARLFEPFFTTKPQRQGLGLARARHVVNSHDGTLVVSYPKDGGLVVTMTLPFSRTAPAPPHAR